jgi:hypothetical protein
MKPESPRRDWRRIHHSPMFWIGVVLCPGGDHDLRDVRRSGVAVSVLSRSGGVFLRKEPLTLPPFDAM